jgi:hypothetical protein
MLKLYWIIHGKTDNENQENLIPNKVYSLSELNSRGNANERNTNALTMRVDPAGRE